MISVNQLDKMINDMQFELTPDNNEINHIKKSEIDTLIWIRNAGTLRTTEEINKRIERYKEELLVFDNDQDLYYRERIARIAQLEHILQT